MWQSVAWKVYNRINIWEKPVASVFKVGKEWAKWRKLEGDKEEGKTWTGSESMAMSGTSKGCFFNGKQEA
jgi:hypothetical protein